jgi:hypothetical protein
VTSAAACSIVFEKKLATQDRPLFSLPRELCPLSLDESRVEIVRGWVTAQLNRLSRSKQPVVEPVAVGWNVPCAK